MTLRLTMAGVAALASSTYTGIAAIRITHIAIGDGSGPGGADDDGRTVLRSERDRSAATGTAATHGRISFRGDFMPAADYNITEAGVFATAGGSTILLAYWTDGGTNLGAAVTNADLVIAATIAFAEAAAEVAVTVSPTISVGEAPVEATAATFGITRYSTVTEGKAGTAQNRSVTPQVMKAAAGKTVASLLGSTPPTDGTVYQLKGTASGELVAEERTQDGTTETEIAALQAKTVDASTTAKGIVELATDEEGIAGEDDERAMTAQSTRAAASATIASLLGSAPVTGTKYALQGATGGALTLVSLAIVAMAVGSTTAVSYQGVQSGDIDRGILAESVEIDGISSWEIQADGTYSIVFALHRVTNDTLVGAIFRQPSGGAAAQLSDQHISFGSGIVGKFFANGGAIWCGNLSADDTISVRFANGSSHGDIAYEAISAGSYKCLGLAIMKHA